MSASDHGGRGQSLVMLRAGAQSLAWWAGAVFLATAAGYPGAVLLTPAAWVLAGGAGYRYALGALAARLRPRLRLAALLGALFGLAMGLICALVVLGWMPVAPHERAVTLRLLVGVTATGAAVCAPMSLMAAWLVRRRYGRLGQGPRRPDGLAPTGGR